MRVISITSEKKKSHKFKDCNRNKKLKIIQPSNVANIFIFDLTFILYPIFILFLKKAAIIR